MYFPNKALDVHSLAKMAFLAYFFRYLMGIKRLFYGAGPTLEKPYVSCQNVLVLLMAKRVPKVTLHASFNFLANLYHLVYAQWHMLLLLLHICTHAVFAVSSRTMQ